AADVEIAGGRGGETGDDGDGHERFGICDAAHVSRRARGWHGHLGRALGRSDMSREIVVRRLETSDAELYRAIRLESLRLHPEAYGSAFETEEARPLSAFADRLTQSHLLGGLEGNELVGIVGFQREEGPKQRHKGYVWGVYVRPAARGRGIA